MEIEITDRLGQDLTSRNTEQETTGDGIDKKDDAKYFPPLFSHKE
jgi:hypothetical protein